MARILIVEARFYGHLNDMLIAGAKAAIPPAGHDAEVITVPGPLELPGAIALGAEGGRYGGVGAVGVVLRGGSSPFDVVRGGDPGAIRPRPTTAEIGRAACMEERDT